MFGATLSLSGQNALEPAIAMTPDGRMLALWTQSDDSFTRPQLSLAGAAGAAPGGFNAPLPFGEVGGTARGTVACMGRGLGSADPGRAVHCRVGGEARPQCPQRRKRRLATFTLTASS